MDGIVDMKVFPPIDVVNFGGEVSGIGDVNGDGLEDFAAGAMLSSFGWWPGVALVYSGFGQVPVDVPGDPSVLPIAVALHPNYPNPFNPSTTISFDLPRRSEVTLAIVNILGQEVARLVNGEVSAGTHSVEWDGRDISGEVVASGVYLYRLETDDGVLSRKMLLLK
ncbi:MAG: T9SS type A sorting domain-containing protein [bacterium]|nr:T9SS type A sorting domain-containing protein [bacterium]